MESMLMLHEKHGRVFTLPPHSQARRLFVLEGRAWITERLRRNAPCGPEDLWLAAGATLCLPAGTAWLVQADGDLRLSLREQGRVLNGWRALFSRLARLGARPRARPWAWTSAWARAWRPAP
jgi:hypothetical protein